MTAADSNLGEDGLTPAGRQAQADKAAAAAQLAAPAGEVAAADQRAAAEREASRVARNAQRRAAAATGRAAQAQRRAEAAQAASDHAGRVAAEVGAQQAPAEAQAAAQAPAQEAPCEPCLQHWQAVAERMERLETQVQAIGKLVLVGIAAGAAAYFLSRRPAPAAELPAGDPAAEAAVAAGLEPAGV